MSTKPFFKVLITAIKSSLKFLFISCVISCLAALVINILWFGGMLGEDCRYYGDYVRNCAFHGVNLDGLAKIFLTAWALPLIGPIAAFMMPPMLGIAITMLLWPPYYLVKAIVTLAKLRKNKDESCNNDIDDEKT